MLQARVTRAMARNFSCGSYVSQCAVTISPYTSLNLGYGNNGDLGTINPRWYVFGLHPPTSCSCSGGSPTSSSLTVSYAWSSGNSSIASIASGASNSLSVWHGAGVGNTVANYQSHQSTYNITCTGQAPANVTYHSLSLSVGRSNLTTTSSTGSPAAVAANPAFTYTVTGSGNTASYTTSDPNANPNTATIGGRSNSGAPIPGALGTLTSKYTCKGGSSVSKSFSVPTFGLSCYVRALETDYISGGSCTSITISGTTYSGSSTNPVGLPAGNYCNAFLGMVRLNGSGQSAGGVKVHYESGSYPSWTFSTISQFTGADGTALVANGSVARDRAYVPRSTTVQLPSGSYAANDTGGAITGYRLDVFMGLGQAACSTFQNNVVVAACNPGVGTCPGLALP